MTTPDDHFAGYLRIDANFPIPYFDDTVHLRKPPDVSNPRVAA